MNQYRVLFPRKVTQSHLVWILIIFSIYLNSQELCSNTTIKLWTSTFSKMYLSTPVLLGLLKKVFWAFIPFNDLETLTLFEVPTKITQVQKWDTWTIDYSSKILPTVIISTTSKSWLCTSCIFTARISRKSSFFCRQQLEKIRSWRTSFNNPGPHLAREKEKRGLKSFK